MRWVNMKLTCTDCGLDVKMTASKKGWHLPLTGLVGKCDCGEADLTYDNDSLDPNMAPRTQEPAEEETEVQTAQ